MAVASNAGNPARMSYHEQMPREQLQTASDPVNAIPGESRPPVTLQDPAIHDRVDAVMGGK
jgi:hypothetical protein